MTKIVDGSHNEVSLRTALEIKLSYGKIDTDDVIATLIQLLVDNKVLTLEQVATMFSYRHKLEE